MVIDWTEKLYMIAIFNQVESVASAVRSKWTSLGYPWMVTVTPEHGSTHGNTLTWQGGVCVDIPELSMAGRSYSGMSGYSDMGGAVDVDIPGLSVDCQSYSQLSTKQLCHPLMAVDCLRHHWTYLDSELEEMVDPLGIQHVNFAILERKTRCTF